MIHSHAIEFSKVDQTRMQATRAAFVALIARTPPGTGLDLSITRKIIENPGGVLNPRQPPGRPRAA